MEDIELWFLFENPNIFIYLSSLAHTTQQVAFAIWVKKAFKNFFTWPSVLHDAYRIFSDYNQLKRWNNRLINLDLTTLQKMTWLEHAFSLISASLGFSSIHLILGNKNSLRVRKRFLSFTSVKYICL